jgi:hypothetical protein
MSDKKEIHTYYNNFLKYFKKVSYTNISQIFNRKFGRWQHPYFKGPSNKCIICKDDREGHITMSTEDFFQTYDISPKTLTKKTLKKKIIANIINSDIGESEILHKKDNANEQYSDTDYTLGYNEISKKLFEFGSKFVDRTKMRFTKMSLKLGYMPAKEVRLSVNDKPQQSEVNTLGEIILNNNINDEHATEGGLKVKKLEYCDICFSDIKDRFSLMCGHFFCRGCMYEYVKNSMGNITQLKNLKCPKAICNEKINDKICEMLFEGEDLKIYHRLKEKIEGLSNPLNLPCPIPDCDSYAPKVDTHKNYLICKEGHKFCVKCLSAYHYGRCKKEEEDLILKNNKMIKRCPNCRTWVEKVDELCNNVTCLNIYCNYTFCWICMRAYDKKHYTNPLSTCFGLASGSHNILVTNKYLRTFKCLLIFILLITLIAPIFIIFFSFIVVTFYILAFVLDGSAIKNVKMKNEQRQKFFRLLVSGIYATMSFALLTFGYITLGGLIIVSPFIYLYKRLTNKTETDNYKI